MDSTHWQTELFPLADRIEEFLSFRRYSLRIVNQLEREVMVAVFSVRVLIERHKLSEELLAQKISVLAYKKKTQKPTTWLNNHKIDELFDLSLGQFKLLDLQFFCNQFIHSYILVPVRDGQEFRRFLFCSDHERNKFLYSVDAEVIVTLLRNVGFDHASHTDMVFDPDPSKRDYKIRNYNPA